MAAANGIDYAADVYPHYGSDVEATLRGGADARHALIGAGVYASHGYERSHVDGVKNTLELLAVQATAVCYLFGTIWFMIAMHTDFVAALLTCVVPFLLADAAKIVVATVLVNRLDKIVKL